MASQEEIRVDRRGSLLDQVEVQMQEYFYETESKLILLDFMNLPLWYQKKPGEHS